MILGPTQLDLSPKTETPMNQYDFPHLYDDEQWVRCDPRTRGRSAKGRCVEAAFDSAGPDGCTMALFRKRYRWWYDAAPNNHKQPGGFQPDELVRYLASDRGKGKLQLGKRS
jgi:hypothetical protein